MYIHLITTSKYIKKNWWIQREIEKSTNILGDENVPCLSNWSSKPKKLVRLGKIWVTQITCFIDFIAYCLFNEHSYRVYYVAGTILRTSVKNWKAFWAEHHLESRWYHWSISRAMLILLIPLPARLRGPSSRSSVQERAGESNFGE